MTDVAVNLLIDHLERWQPVLDRIERQLDGMIAQSADIELRIEDAKVHLSKMSEAKGAIQVTMDKIGRRLDRIERRLELAN